MTILEQDIQYLPGVGPQRKKMLNEELGIHTYGDLLEYYPYKYVDRSKVYTVRELTGDMPSCKSWAPFLVSRSLTWVRTRCVS